MGINVFPAASASGKTRYQQTLTSGTSYTVPAGVNYLVVTTLGGGGGAGSISVASANSPGAGGTTTFTGATSASGGSAGYSFARGNSNTVYQSVGGQAATANSGLGGSMGISAVNMSNDNAGVSMFGRSSFSPTSGQIVTSIVNTSPGANINYAIGAGGSAGNSFGNCGGSGSGGAGGSGRIEIEYWV